MPITEYKIYWDQGLENDEYSELVVVDFETFQYTNYAVVPGTVYNYRVLATNVVGDSLLSDPLTIKAAQRPETPSLPVSVEHNTYILKFSWSAPFDNYDAITDYRVYWDAGDQDLTLFTQLTPTSYGGLEWIKDNNNLPELVPGQYYRFKVAAVNSIGESDQSEALTMIAATVPDAPAAPELLQSGRTYVEISWFVSYDGGAQIDDYEIDWKLDTDETYTSIIGSTAGETSFRI